MSELETVSNAEPLLHAHIHPQPFQGKKRKGDGKGGEVQERGGEIKEGE